MNDIIYGIIFFMTFWIPVIALLCVIATIIYYILKRYQKENWAKALAVSHILCLVFILLIREATKVKVGILLTLCDFPISILIIFFWDIVDKNIYIFGKNYIVGVLSFFIFGTLQFYYIGLKIDNYLNKKKPTLYYNKKTKTVVTKKNKSGL